MEIPSQAVGSLARAARVRLRQLRYCIVQTTLVGNGGLQHGVESAQWRYRAFVSSNADDHRAGILCGFAGHGESS